MTNPTVSNSYLASNPDYVVETEEVTPGVNRQVVKVAEMPPVTVDTTGLATDTLQTAGNTLLSAIKTAVELLDNAVTGSYLATKEATYANSSVTSVASSASSVELLASTAGRKGAYFFNDADKIAYVKLGTTASTSSFTVKIVANGYYELAQPCYTGEIDCIWESSPTGSMRITEIS